MNKGMAEINENVGFNILGGSSFRIYVYVCLAFFMYTYTNYQSIKSAYMKYI